MDERVAAALTSGLLGYFFLQLNYALFSDWSINILFIGIIVSLAYLVIGFILSALLILPLKYVYQYTPLWVSAFIYVTCGVSLAGFLIYESAWLGHHNQNPYQGKGSAQAFFNLYSFSFIGGASALSSWIATCNKNRAD